MLSPCVQALRGRSGAHSGVCVAVEALTSPPPPPAREAGDHQAVAVISKQTYKFLPAFGQIAFVIPGWAVKGKMCQGGFHYLRRHQTCLLGVLRLLSMEPAVSGTMWRVTSLSIIRRVPGAIPLFLPTAQLLLRLQRPQ